MLREPHSLTHTDMLTNVTIRKQEGYSPCNKCAQHKWDQFFFLLFVFKKLRNKCLIRSEKKQHVMKHISSNQQKKKKEKIFFHII